MRLARIIRGGALTAWVVASGCGSRTAFDVTDGPPPPPECTKDADCDGFDNLCAPVTCDMGSCLAGAVVSCDDANPCTIDSCEPATGLCAHPWITLDVDNDQHYAPLPGHLAGDPGSCGDDCNDTNAAAHPGALEDVCDGVDNDCNGIVDDGARLIPVGDAVQISSASQASPAALVGRGAAGYTSAYSAEVGGHNSVYLALLRDTGAVIGSSMQFTNIAADAFGGPLAWTGDRFGLAWADRRDARGIDDNYEVYFNLVNPDGTKRIADLRITNAPGFSINPALVWTGDEFVVLWQDDGMGTGGQNALFGQRISIDGTLIGGNVRLVVDSMGQTAPVVAAGPRSLGVVWMRGDAAPPHHMMFAPFDATLGAMQAPVELTGAMMSGVIPSVVYNRGQYIVAWHDQDFSPKTVYGTVRGDLGEQVIAAKALVDTPAQARYPALLPYGDRLLLVWSDLRDDNVTYELYAKTIDTNLNPLQSDVRLTNAPGNSVDPILAFGPNGSAGIFFTDYRTGAPQAFFTGLACVTSAR